MPPTFLSSYLLIFRPPTSDFCLLTSAFGLLIEDIAHAAHASYLLIFLPSDLPSSDLGPLISGPLPLSYILLACQL